MVKGSLQDLRQFLATESPLKIMKSAFYFMLEGHTIELSCITFQTVDPELSRTSSSTTFCV